MPIYMHLSGLPGSSVAVGYEGWHEIFSFSWGMSNPTNAALQVSEMNIACALDLSAPRIMLVCARGTLLSTAIVSSTLIRGGEKPIEYMRYTMTDVLVSSFQQSLGSGEDTPPMAQLSLNFTKITYKQAYQAKDGKILSQSNFWDLKSNTGG